MDALPSRSGSFAVAKVTVPGPRYFAHSTTRPAGSVGLPRFFGRPSSVAETFTVTARPVATDAVSALASTTGGRFELMSLTLPPRVVRRRSICHWRPSVPATDIAWPCTLSVQTTLALGLKSLGTVTLKMSL